MEMQELLNLNFAANPEPFHISQHVVVPSKRSYYHTIPYTYGTSMIVYRRKSVWYIIEAVMVKRQPSIPNFLRIEVATCKECYFLEIVNYLLERRRSQEASRTLLCAQ
eukprot:6176969-Pleurochrysis_carterae.AAC.1